MKVDRCYYGPPGTGKTTTLMKDIKQFLNDGYNLSDITYETFRRTMAEDFKRRLVEDLGLENKGMTFISTTHSIAYRLLASEHGWNTKNNVALPWRHYVQFCKENHIPITRDDVEIDVEEGVIKTPDEYETFGAKVYIIYCNCINTLTPFDKWYELPSYMRPNFTEPISDLYSVIVDIIEKWIKWQEENNRYDFAMMLKLCLEEKLTPNTSIYMSDETHDKTPIQVELSKLWARDADYVYYAFDIMQTIYSFWGTDPSFCYEVWKKAKEKVVLTPSYRLSYEIYNTARLILKKSGQNAPDIECKGEGVVRIIKPNKFLDLVKILDKVAILARTTYHLKVIANELAREGIIYTGIGGWGGRMLSVYKVVYNYRNGLPIERSDFIKFVEAYPAEFFITTKERIKKIAPYELQPEDVDKYITYSFRKLIKESEKPFDSILNSYISADAKMKMNVALAKNAKPIPKAILCTIHGSKGLEWDNVILFDGITRKITISIETYESEFKNECRVWYVGMTRAKKCLFIIPSSFFSSGLSRSFIGGVLRC